jgi:hypothetical protein
LAWEASKDDIHLSSIFFSSKAGNVIIDWCVCEESFLHPLDEDCLAVRLPFDISNCLNFACFLEGEFDTPNPRK